MTTKNTLNGGNKHAQKETAHTGKADADHNPRTNYTAPAQIISSILKRLNQWFSIPMMIFIIGVNTGFMLGKLI